MAWRRLCGTVSATFRRRASGAAGAIAASRFPIAAQLRDWLMMQKGFGTNMHNLQAAFPGEGGRAKNRSSDTATAALPDRNQRSIIKSLTGRDSRSAGWGSTARRAARPTRPEQGV